MALYADRVQAAAETYMGLVEVGVGLIPGTMLGVLFLRVVIDSVAKIIKFGSADDYEGIIVGFLVVLAVAFNELRQARRGSGKQFFPGALGAMAIGILSLLSGVLTTIMVGKQAGVTVFAVLIALGLITLLRRRFSPRRIASTARLTCSDVVG